MMTPAYQLVMQKGPTPGLVFDLVKPEITIGRDITNDFVISDAEVSRKHVTMKMEAGRYIIEDMNSTNGTFINGNRLIGPHSLSVNELISLGEKVELVFEAVKPELDITIASSSQDALNYNNSPLQKPAIGQPVFVLPPEPAISSYPTPPLYPIESEPFVPSAQQSSQSLWVLAGCGCLVIMAVICAGAVLAVEYFNLWCTLFGGLIPGCQ